MTNRIYAFEAIENFRDYGDYTGVAGRLIKPGVLFRSAHQAKATDADLVRLGALDLGTLVDLRRPSERHDMPSRRPAGFDAEVIETAKDDGSDAPHITFLKTQELTGESGRRFMDMTYRGLPFEPSHVDAFKRYFHALANGTRPVLIHCAAGKDRTGFLAAITHHLLGVSRDDLLADYLLTNAAVDLEHRGPEIARKIEKAFGKPVSDEAMIAFLGVEESYLDAAFTEIDKRYGSMDAYLDVLIGLDTAQRDRIVERLTT